MNVHHIRKEEGPVARHRLRSRWAPIRTHIRSHGDRREYDVIHMTLGGVDPHASLARFKV